MSFTVRSRVVASLAMLALALTGLVAIPQTALGLSGSDFNPGNIISDAAFFDSGTMTEAQIQDFLNNKVPACSGGYVCLKNYKISTYTRPSTEVGHCTEYVGEANESASRIILKVAKACNINPQTLLVLLQKETGLVTATSPSDSTYRKAAGYGCPDTSVCDSAFYGFYNQVYKAAWQFRQYTNHPDRTYHIGSVSVGFNPSSSCGSTVVNIQNQATANLYNYTPYQPNGAALSNLGGTGDSCSSYGNRNFWVYFSNWFGSTNGPIDPMASLDSATLQQTSSSASIAVSGWVMDRTQIARTVEVGAYVDQPDGSSIGYSFMANGVRTDVGTAYPGAGNNHGFAATFPVKSAGTYRVCLFPVTGGAGWLLACSSFKVAAASPSGVLDSVRAVQANGVASIAVSGWSLDAATLTKTTRVDVYLDKPDRTAVVASIQANGDRPDIALAFAGAGGAHGFSTVFPAAQAGDYRACAYAISSSIFGEASAPIGCQSLRVAASVPIGSLDYLTLHQDAHSSSLTVGGWAIDSSWLRTPLAVHLYVDYPNGSSTGTAYTADQNRVDVGAAFPAAGSGHGFSTSIPISAPGNYRVCAFGIGSSLFGGGNALMGCLSTRVVGTVPFGALDSATVTGPVGGRKIKVTGWAMDSAVPATAIPVHIYIDSPDGKSNGYPVTADGNRPDVGAAYVGFGNSHGFTLSVPATLSGVHRICVFPIAGAQFGSNGFLGCRSVNVG